MAGNSNQSGTAVTTRALAILSTFDVDHPYQTLTQISRRCGLPMATVHRLIRDLEAWGAVERDPGGAYHVGIRLWEIGVLTPSTARLREVALPYMQDLYETTRENVHLAVPDQYDVLYVDRLSGHRSVPIVSRAGSRLPMHATGVGKALLAHQTPGVVTAYCQRPLQRCTRHTIVEPGRLTRELAEIRKRGYARTSEEMTLGTCSVAAAILDTEGIAIAAIGIVVHSVRADLIKLVPGLKTAANRIEQRLLETVAGPTPRSFTN